MFDELRRYVGWGPADERALRNLAPLVAPSCDAMAEAFYRRAVAPADLRAGVAGAELERTRLRQSLARWLDALLAGPWDEAYRVHRTRMGRAYVRSGVEQHAIVCGVHVIRGELARIVDAAYADRPQEAHAARAALGKALDLDLALMIHAYREAHYERLARRERLATIGALVGSIGHELRNPFTVIDLSLHLLRGHHGGDASARKHIDRIAGQLALSNRIIDDLLELIHDRPLSRQPTLVAAVLEDALGAVVRGAGVALIVSGVDALPEIDADPGQLRQVFVNLVVNAVEAVGKSGEVRIAGSLRGETVEITVEDTGPGVAPRMRGRLFEPLETTKVHGLGLGLPLVKRLVERHDGSVAYEEPAAGGAGARFVVRLPVIAAAPAAPTSA